MTERYFFCLRQLFRSDASLFHLINDAQNQLLGCFAFLRVEGSINAK